MKLSQFSDHLRSAPEAELCFVLPDGGRIAAHAHITEVGRVDKTFVDCGGTVRRVSSCSLQAWVADDTEHRLAPGKLATVIERAAPLLGNDDLDVEIEYEDGFLSQFPVSAAEARDGVLLFFLTTKHTDCLAKDVCLPKTEAQGCCSGSGCC